jgi:hypothetical protein
MGCSRKILRSTLLIALLFRGPASVRPETSEADPAAFIGMTLGELIAERGAPESVHALRGAEEWQDDVVFVYPDGDYYVYKDRVWQLGLPAAYGIKVGDRQSMIPLVLGEKVQTFDAYTLFSIGGRAWPLTLRLNVGRNGLVSEIFIYRPDF